MDDYIHVVIGMDPHKRSVTAKVMTSDEQVLGGGRFTTDVKGFTSMLAYVAAWPDCVWAIEGCEGIGRLVAQRLIAEGELVVDVPAKLSARVRVFAAGQGRKTDDTDAHSIALVGVRVNDLRTVVDNELLVDPPSPPRRGAHPDGLPASPPAAGTPPRRGKARPLRCTGAQAAGRRRPRDLVDKTRKQHAMELVVDRERIYQRKTAANEERIEVIKTTP